MPKLRAGEDSYQGPNSWDAEEADLIVRPSEGSLKTIGAFQTTSLKALRGELSAMLARVDGLAGLAEHLLMLHEPRHLDVERFARGIAHNNKDPPGCRHMRTESRRKAPSAARCTW